MRIHYIPDDQDVEIVLRDRNYKAQLKASIVYVRKKEDQWMYAFQVFPKTAKDKSQYSQIIYDRNHSLPIQMDLWSTAYDDMMRNIQLRIKKSEIERRKLPRIELRKKVMFSNGTTGIIEDFNFKYITVSHLSHFNKNLEFYQLITSSNLIILLKPEKVFSNKILFRIMNLDELIQNEQIDQLLLDLK